MVSEIAFLTVKIQKFQLSCVNVQFNTIEPTAVDTNLMIAVGRIIDIMIFYKHFGSVNLTTILLCHLSYLERIILY